MSERKAFTSVGADVLVNELYASSSTGILIIDRNGRVNHVNTACLRILGLDDIGAITDFDFFASPFLPGKQREFLKHRQKVRFEKDVDIALAGLSSTREGVVKLSFSITPFESEAANSDGGYLAQIQDISSVDGTDKNLLMSYEKIESEKLLNSVALRLFGATRETIDQELNKVLVEIAEFLNVDRIYLVLPDNTHDKLSCQHEWHRSGFMSVKRLFCNMSRNKFHWVFDRLSKGPIFITDPDELASEDIGEFSQIFELNACSVMLVPLELSAGMGFIGFDTVAQKKFWDSALVGALEFLAGIIANILAKLYTQDTLLAMNDQFTLFMENLPAGAFIRRLDGKLVYTNRSLGGMLGFDSWQSVSSGITIPEELDRIIEKKIAYALEGGENSSVESFVDAKGNHKTAMLTLFPLQKVDDDLLVGGILRDLSDAQVLEKDLQQARIRCEQAFAMAKMGFWEVDYSGDKAMMTFSPELKELLGLSQETHRYSMSEMARQIHPAERDMLVDNFRIAMKNHMPFWMIHRCVTNEGKELFLQQKGQGIYDSQGNLIAASGLAQDVTEQITANQKLQYQRELLDCLVDSIPTAVIAKEFKGRGEYVLYNTPAQNIVGLKPIDVIGKTEVSFVAESSLPIWNKLDQEILGAGNKKSFNNVELEFISGKKSIIRGIKFPIYDINGNASMIVTIMDEIEPAAVVEDVEVKAETPQACDIELMRSMNNLVQMISCCTRELDDSLVEPVHREIVDKIQIAVKEACRISQQGLLNGCEAFSQSSKLLVFPQIESEMQAVFDKAVGSGRVNLDVMNDVPPVEIDFIQLMRALVNLCVNADQAMGGVGRIMVSCGHREFFQDELKSDQPNKPGMWAYASVVDEGPGLEPDELERVFEPFYKSGSNSESLGIGLAVAKNIIENYGGFIDVRSRIGVGSTFTVYLPVVKHVEEEQQRDMQGGQRQNNETILFAEDDELVRNLIRHYFEKAGYEILVASDGEEAIKLYDKNRDDIDILVLDVIMPRKNGKEVYDHVMAYDSDMPVVFCSGYSDSILKSEYLLSIPGKLLHKPCPPGKLLTAIRESLDENNSIV